MSYLDTLWNSSNSESKTHYFMQTRIHKHSFLLLFASYVIFCATAQLKTELGLELRRKMKNKIKWDISVQEETFHHIAFCIYIMLHLCNVHIHSINQTISGCKTLYKIYHVWVTRLQIFLFIEIILTENLINAFLFFKSYNFLRCTLIKFWIASMKVSQSFVINFAIFIVY